MSPLVPYQAVLPTKRPATISTIVVFPFEMLSSDMLLQIPLLGKNCLTEFALKWPLPQVHCANVSFQITLIRETFVAFCAIMIFYLFMFCFFMPPQSRPVTKC